MYKVGVALTTLLAGTAFADLSTTRIAPSAAYAPNSTGKEYVRNAINGGGLNADGLTHSTGKENSTWRSEGAPSWFVMDLGKVYSVADIKIWNYNGSKATASGLKQIDILFSVDDDAYSAGVDYSNGKWTEVVTDIELAKSAGDGSNSYTGCDPIVLSTPKNARFIGFRIESTWGNVNGGLSEIRVDVVDETYSVALDGLSFDASQTSATFTGTLTATDETGAEVFLAYGTEDAKMDLGTWENTASCGTQASGAQFTKTISGLAADKAYYGALFVMNQGVASSWSETTNFITGVVSVQMPPSFCEAETATKHIVFTRPATCAAETLEIPYALSGDAESDYSASLVGTVAFAAGETEAVVAFTPVKDTESAVDKTLTVTVQPGLYVTDATSVGSVTVLDTSSVTASNPSWTGAASTMDWDTAGNWSSSAVPNYLDAVTIDAASSKSSPVLSTKDHSVVSLQIGNSENSSGALRLSGNGAIYVTGAGYNVIGGHGNGYLEINDAAELRQGLNYEGSGIEIGRYAGSTGEVVINGGKVSAYDFTVGDVGEGSLTLNGGTVAVSTTASDGHGDFSVGKSAGSVGAVTINGGTCGRLRTLNIGNAGTGCVTLKGGMIEVSYRTHIGVAAGSHGKLVIDGGTVSATGSNRTHFGSAGEAEIDVTNGTLTISSTAQFGASSTGRGVIWLRSGGKMTGVNTSVYLGNGGEGQLFLRGGTLGKTGNGAAALVVRNTAASYGLLSGWGTISVGKSYAIRNNGLFIADGRDDDGIAVERTLSYSCSDYTGSSFDNTIENDSTNGWYAVNKGLLSVRVLASVAVGDSGVYTWGEFASDDQIDLVNSARITFANITTAISALTGNLYAPDRSDVPALPSGKEAVGVWKFDITGAYESAEVEFRYDHVKAPRGVQMYQLNADGTTWTRLEPTLLEGYRAKVAVTDASRMFAAVAAKSGMSVILR